MDAGPADRCEKSSWIPSYEMTDTSAMQFCEEGGTLTIYLASGKRKHDRVFWVDRTTGTISWDKKKSTKPNKSESLIGVESAPAIKSAKEWFDLIDADKSGELDANEFAELYKKAVRAACTAVLPEGFR
jgi:hypothetical protein